MSISEFHATGGMPYMALLTLTLLINLFMIAFVLYCLIQKKAIHPNWFEGIRQLGGLALATGAFFTLIGLFQSFQDLESMRESLPVQVIMGGVKVAMITTLYGFGIFVFSLLSYLALKFSVKNALG